ncbi:MULTISPECIES: phage tail protein [unclassified Streptomyces]|uniref:phage tail protein n=1 Tax=unclassified Streptomyces TaxID=2593676 RepID=UPI00226DD1D4|nr:MULTISPECIES: phage tail protein [unclassified Streptomyces]MCY0924231.1 phage tail protein [Streptomyces sp. H27-G5]MCY0962865.1 phage tail protein [Streptomyces sp. H27-H5]
MSPVPESGGVKTPRTGELLPSVYDDDSVIQAFAAAIDTALEPITEALDAFPTLLDPWLAPARFLPWLAHVSGARVEPGWTDLRCRAAIDMAPWINARRGTPEALRTEARYVYGWKLNFTEPGERPGFDRLTVTARQVSDENDEPLDLTNATIRAQLERLIRAHCPAHIPYEIIPGLTLTARHYDRYWADAKITVMHPAQNEPLTVDFGDGEPEWVGAADEEGKPVIIHHSYATPDTYTIKVQGESEDAYDEATFETLPLSLELQDGDDPYTIKVTVSQAQPTEQVDYSPEEGGPALPGQPVEVSFVDSAGTVYGPQSLQVDEAGTAFCEQPLNRPGVVTVTATQPTTDPNKPHTTTDTYDVPGAMIISVAAETMAITVTAETTALTPRQGQDWATVIAAISGGVEGETLTVDFGDETDPVPARVGAGGTADLPHTYTEHDTYTITLKDATGQTTLATATFTVVYIPDAPTITSPAQDHTVGVNPEITGTCEPGATVTVEWEGSATDPATVTPGGNLTSWTLTPTTALAASAGALTATQTIPESDTSPESILRINVVDIPDAPTITSPAQYHNVDFTPEITGKALPGTTIDLWNSGRLIGENVAVDTEGEWAYTPTTNLVAGPGSLQARQYLNGGPHSDSGIVKVYVGPIPPPRITAPTSGTVPSRPPMTGDCVAGATVTVKRNNTAITPDAEVTNTGWTLTPGPLPTGTSTLTAVQTLPGSDPSPESDPVDINVVATPGLPTFEGPPAGDVSVKPVIAGTCEAGATVNVTTSLGTITPATVTPGGNATTWTLTPTSNLQVGAHTLSATQTTPGGTSPAATLDINVRSMAITITPGDGLIT